MNVVEDHWSVLNIIGELSECIGDHRSPLDPLGGYSSPLVSFGSVGARWRLSKSIGVNWGALECIGVHRGKVESVGDPGVPWCHLENPPGGRLECASVPPPRLVWQILIRIGISAMISLH